MKWKFLHNFTFNNLTSSSKENEAPLDSLVQQIKTNNKLIWKNAVNEKWAILFWIDSIKNWNGISWIRIARFPTDLLQIVQWGFNLSVLLLSINDKKRRRAIVCCWINM